MGVRDIFGGIGRAASMFEEPVAVAASKEDSDGVRRRGTVSAVVVVGAGLSAGAGALVHPETADRFSVVVRREAWRAALRRTARRTPCGTSCSAAETRSTACRRSRRGTG